MFMSNAGELCFLNVDKSLKKEYNFATDHSQNDQQLGDARHRQWVKIFLASRARRMRS